MARTSYISICWDDDVRFTLDRRLDDYSAISLKQQSIGRHVASLGYTILFLSQPVFTLTLPGAFFAEKQQIPT